MGLVFFLLFFRTRPPRLIAHKRSLIIAIIGLLAIRICTLHALVALGYALHALAARENALLDHDATAGFSAMMQCATVASDFDFCSVLLVIRIDLAADNDFARLLDLVADGREADDAVAVAGFGVGVAADEAGELVHRSALRAVVGAAGVVAGGEFGGGAEFLCHGVHACLARGGDCNALDEVGHCHLDVEFDHIGERVELDVAVAVLY